MLRPSRRFTVIALIVIGLGGLLAVGGSEVAELVCLVNEQEAQPLSELLPKQTVGTETGRHETARMPSLTQVAYRPKLRAAALFQSEKLQPAGEDEVCVENVAESDSMLAEDSLDPADIAARKNPFEFGKGVVFETAQGGAERVENLKLYGFVGNAPQKAIIHASGRTKILAAGERWGVIEMLEVKPPEVRIRVDGVTRTWSLRSKQSGSNP